MADQFDPSAQNFNPDPTSQMMNYQYVQNQQLMQMQQTNLQSAINTATNNAQAQMQTVLQGTMAASMALYQTGKSVTDQAHERVYQDQLMNGGNYVMERSGWRDFMWGVGVSQTDFGRSLKVGGRRPEFLNNQEYEYQRARSWGYRKEEIGDMLIGGGAAIAGSAIGTAIMPGLGTVGGMAAGFIIDETVGKILTPYMQYRRAGREMRQFAESTDMNWGGARRVSKDIAQELGEYGWKSEKNVFDFVPFGGSIAERIRPEQTFTKTYKSMSQLGLLKDTDLQDVDELKKMVEKTIQFTDKMAGVLHASREGVLKLKATFQRLGLNDNQQNAAIKSIAHTTLATGLDAEMATNAYAAFQELGAQSGFFLKNNAGLQAESGLRELERIRAGQAAGNISLRYDAGTLAQQRFVTAAEMAKSPYGTVVQYGQGSTGMAVQEFARMGGGDSQLGYLLRNTEVYGSQKGVMEIQKDMIHNVHKAFHGNIKSTLGWAEATGGTALKNQVLEELTGVSAENEHRSRYDAAESARIKIGMGHDQGYYNQFTLTSLNTKDTDFIIKNDKAEYGAKLTKVLQEVKGQHIENEAGQLYGVYKTLQSKGWLGKKSGEYLWAIEHNEGDPEKIKKDTIAQIKKEHDVTDEEAERIFKTNVADTDKFNTNRPIIHTKALGQLAMGNYGALTSLVTIEGDSLEKLQKQASGSSIAEFLSRKEKRLKNNMFKMEDYKKLNEYLREDVSKDDHRKRVDVILEELAGVGDDKGKKAAIYKKYGLMGMKVGGLSAGTFGPSWMNLDGSDTLAEMAVMDVGRDLHGNDKALKSVLALTNIYGSMKDDEKERIKKDFKVTNVSEYIKANKEWQHSLGTLASAAKESADNKRKTVNISDEAIRKLAHDATINGAFAGKEDEVFQRFSLARANVDLFQKEVTLMGTKIQTGTEENTPDKIKEEANMEAIKAFTKVCETLNESIQKNR